MIDDAIRPSGEGSKFPIPTQADARHLPERQEVRRLGHFVAVDQASVIAKGRLVYTGPTQALGSDIDTFEEKLIALLTHGG